MVDKEDSWFFPDFDHVDEMDLIPRALYSRNESRLTEGNHVEFEASG